MRHCSFSLFIAIISFLISCDSGGGSTSGGNSYSPSFTGNTDSSSGTYVLRTVNTVYANGASAGCYEVIQRGRSQYARRVGGIQEYDLNIDYNNGYNYVFWNGAAWLFFY